MLIDLTFIIYLLFGPVSDTVAVGSLAQTLMLLTLNPSCVYVGVLSICLCLSVRFVLCCFLCVSLCISLYTQYMFGFEMCTFEEKGTISLSSPMPGDVPVLHYLIKMSLED